MTDVRNMRKIMEAVDEWQQVNEVSAEQHKDAIVALVDVLARDAVEQVENGDATLDIAMKNLVHQAMADIKMRLPERVDHYVEYGRETPDFYYGAPGDEV